MLHQQNNLVSRGLQVAVGTAGYYRAKPHHDRYGMEIPHELCQCYVVIFGIRRKLNKELQHLRGKKEEALHMLPILAYKRRLAYKLYETSSLWWLTLPEPQIV